jgi:hypothetical protein
MNVVGIVPLEKGAMVDLTDATAQEAAQALGEFLAAQKYRLEQGTPVNGVYGSGSKVARAVLGGMVKRSKYDVTIAENAGTVRITLVSAMSGWSGSVLGMAREKKQRTQLFEQLKTHFAQWTPSP